MASIEVQKLVKKYGDFTAVDGVSFSVEHDETFGILGPNGAGKTTTLEVIEGLKTPTSGAITVDGKDAVRDTLAVKSVIGVQLQASSFFEGLTIKELIEIFGALYDREVDAMKLLDDVQLGDKAKNQVKELSGGQKQRLSIAVALVNDPKILFPDEPTTGLDPQARHNLWDLVTEIRGRGKTVVLTTHYMDEAEVLCDRIAIMDHGKIVALDTTEKLLLKSGVHPRIEFKVKKAIPDAQLKALPGVEEVVHEGMNYTLTTSDSQQTLSCLFRGEENANFGIEELTVKRATLEDVFLKLTGHELRD